MPCHLYVRCFNVIGIIKMALTINVTGILTTNVQKLIGSPFTPDMQADVPIIRVILSMFAPITLP